jgi:transcriptional regulator with XRE-family HTH domain
MDKIERERLLAAVVAALGDRNINEVARRTGISSATLSRIENGRQPSRSTLTALKNYLLIEQEQTARALREVLQDAVRLYGKEGGPWNVPSDPGGWLSRARQALGVKR